MSRTRTRTRGHHAIASGDISDTYLQYIAINLFPNTLEFGCEDAAVAFFEVIDSIQVPVLYSINSLFRRHNIKE